MSRPARAPLRDRIPADPNGTHHTVEGEPAAITKHTPRPALTGTVVEPAPVSAAYQRIEADRLWAEHMAQSGMLPADYRDNPSNVIWAIGYARALNIPTMTALNEIYLSKGGKPTMTTNLMAALVRRAGHTLEVSLHRPQGEPLTEMFASARLRRADNPGFTFEDTWDLNRAARAGLLQIVEGRPISRSASNKVLPWEAYTEAMLLARATSGVLRMSCQDVLTAVAYTPEELGAVVDEEGRPLDLGQDGEGFVTYDDVGGLGGFDGPEVDPVEGYTPDADHWEQEETPTPAASAPPPGPEGFDPATADREQWVELIHRMTEAEDMDGLRWLYREGRKHRPHDTGLQALFPTAQNQPRAPRDEMNPNPF